MSSHAPADQELRATPVDLAIDWLYGAYNRHSAAAAAELYCVDGTHREVAQRRLSQGRSEILTGLERFFVAFPDARWQERVRIVSASAAAVSYRLTGSLHVSLAGITPQGQRLDLDGVHLITLSGERIQSTEDFWDAATFFDQMKGG